MKATVLRAIGWLAILAMWLPGTVGFARAAAPVAAAPRALHSAASQLKRLPDLSQAPLLFIQNQGQMDRAVSYYVQGSDSAIFFTGAGITFALTSPARYNLKLDFISANPGLQMEAGKPAETKVSYFKGPASQWRAGLPTYQSLVYHNLWPGIDLAFSGTASQLKYEFTLQPGADPRLIRLAYRGATSLSVNAAGQMVIAMPQSELKDDAPLAYQHVDGRRKTVDAAYALQPGSASYAFAVSAYDPALPLVIDPVVFFYSGFIGGTGPDTAWKVAIDASGAAYVTGYTYSNQASFPVKAGPDITFNGGNSDAFILKVRPDGAGLVYAGYIGGSGDDEGYGVAVDSSGAAYVTGTTASDPTTFPVKVGPKLTFGGEADGFVAKVSPDGSSLVYCGYIGGSNSDWGSDIVVDSSGAAFIAGPTASDQATFPVKVGPNLIFGGEYDGFVAKVKPDGTGFAYSGYIGGADLDFAYGIAIDASGNAYVVGTTDSTQASFPVKVGPDLTYNGASNNLGFGDVFVAKVKADGSGLIYAGYIGGSADDISRSIAVDSSGAAYVAGWTYSSQASFPVKGGPGLTFNGGAYDAFVAKVKPDGTGLVYAGYIGGNGEDAAYDIALNSSGAVYITGYTTSSQATFPVKNWPYKTMKGASDGFIAKVLPTGAGLEYAGYIGGDSGNDNAYGVAVDNHGAVYVVGETSSTQTSFPVKVGPDLTQNGDADAFVMKFLESARQTFLPLVKR